MKGKDINIETLELMFEEKTIKKIYYIGRSAKVLFMDGSSCDKCKIDKRIYKKCSNCSKDFYLKSGINYYLRQHMINDRCIGCRYLGELNPFYGKEHSEKSKKSIGEKNKINSSGERNPFYGKSHTEQTKKLLSSQRLGKLCGKDNPFFGKTHSKESVEKIINANKNYWIKMTPHERKKLSKALSNGQQNALNSDPRKYSENKKKAAFQSAKSQRKYKKNKIERILEKELKSRGLEKFEYSIILGNFQFDFGNKEHRILIEVQGDYWHGNPKFFGDEVKVGKRLLNETQIAKKEKDKAKKKFAKDKGFKLFTIWEDDILNGNYLMVDELELFIMENIDETSKNKKERN